MKATELLSTLPSGWQTVPIKAACYFTVSNVDKHSIEDEIPVRLCNYTDVYKNERVSPELELMAATATQDEIEKFHLVVGDVIITKDSESWDDIGIPAYVEATAEDFVCGYHLAFMRPNNELLDGRFLFRCVQSRPVALQLELEASGVTRYGLPKGAIGNAIIPLPSLETQRLIADYLDRETARIDTLVVEKEKMLVLLEEKRLALISRAVTRGLDPTSPLKPSGLDWLGDIPAHWDVIQVRFACPSLQTGPFGSQLHAEEYIDNGTPVINPVHLKDNKITPDYGISVDDETADRLSVHKLKEGDVVFGRRGELGRCGVVELSQVGWLCGTGSLRVRCDQTMVDPKYLALVFNGTDAAKRLTVESVGSTMDNLNTEMLSHFRIPYPSIDEQKVIVSQVETAHTKTRKLIDQLLKSIDLAKERRAALITAAVTGLIPIEEISV